ncbi:MAG: putative sugar O-methyltransferase [Betaproteobacteria bacterium]
MKAEERPNYGHVWTDPARQLRRIIESRGSSAQALSEALALGFFSQYTCYTDPSFVTKVVDWQLALLRRQFGSFLEAFPSDFEERATVPETTIVSRDGRRLTPDLLRNVWYCLQIRALSQGKSNFADATVLEIGSGSGSFARVFKALNPNARLWLIDLPESLHFAAIYLRTSFPDARMLLAESMNDLEDDLSSFDFVLVPLRLKDALKGCDFDLALNIWSFGEMPNRFVEDWFHVIQTQCRVRFMFTINAFLAPVTHRTVERTHQGDWVFQFDRLWDVLHFEVNVPIHRNPYIRNFYTGLCVYAQRLDNEAPDGLDTGRFEEILREVLSEDWTQIVSFERLNRARPESEFQPSFDLSPVARHEFFLPQLLATSEYIGRFNLDTGGDSTLFKLWDHYRLTRSPWSGGLLVCFLAMISKTILQERCTKEELQLLKRLPRCKLHEDYTAFLPQLDEPILPRMLDSRTQGICDLAVEAFQAGSYNEAKKLFASVCVESPEHGEAWYYLALCYKQTDAAAIGALCARMAYNLGLRHDHYRRCLRDLSSRLRGENRLTYLCIYLLTRLTFATSGALEVHLSRLLARRRYEECVLVGSLIFVSGVNDPGVLLRIADALDALDDPTLGQVMRKAGTPV